MADRYIPPAWRDRGTSRPTEDGSRTFSGTDGRPTRGAIPPRGRGRGQPISSGQSRWGPPQGRNVEVRDEGIWSSMPRETASTRPLPEPEADIWSSIPSGSTSRLVPDKPTPRSSQPVQRETNSSVREAVPVSSFQSGIASRSSNVSTTPRRPQPLTSLASPSADLTPISSTHRAFKQLDEMEMLGTLSRSGGSEDGVGDGLLDAGTQEKFYAWIEDKLENFYISHPTFREGDPTDSILYPQTDEQIEQERAGKESLDVILLHFRKIREGILASRRMDAFSVKVYEQSSLLAIRSRNHPQLVSSLSVLVNSIYSKSNEARQSTQSLEIKVQGLSLETTLRDRRAFFTSLLLMYHIAHRDSSLDFWQDYFALARRQRKSAAPDIDGSHPEILLSLRAYRAITQPSPLEYCRLLRSDIKMEQKIILGFALERMRQRTWEMMRTGWSQGVGLGFAGSLIGYPLVEVPLAQSAEGDGDEWDAHLAGKSADNNPPNPVGLLKSLGGRVDGNKVFFK